MLKMAGLSEFSRIYRREGRFGAWIQLGGLVESNEGWNVAEPSPCRNHTQTDDR